jgi:hypothetical protein
LIKGHSHEKSLCDYRFKLSFRSKGSPTYFNFLQFPLEKLRFLKYQFFMKRVHLICRIFFYWSTATFKYIYSGLLLLKKPTIWILVGPGPMIVLAATLGPASSRTAGWHVTATVVILLPIMLFIPAIPLLVPAAAVHPVVVPAPSEVVASPSVLPFCRI